MGCTLHQHGHNHGGTAHSGHSHGNGQTRGRSNSVYELPHDHSYLRKRSIDIISQSINIKESKKENINVKAAFIHVVGDFVQSIGVFISALLIYFLPEWKIVDPICTFIFSILVLATTVSILRNTINVLMEGKAVQNQK